MEAEPKPTTAVIMVKFKGQVDLLTTFRLLQITSEDDLKASRTHSYIDYSCLHKHYSAEAKEMSTASGYPHNGQPGFIWAMSYEKAQRGSKPQGGFKNCIMLTMSICNKNVAMKLASGSIHLCGIKNESMAMETFEVLKYNINSIEEVLNYMKRNPEAVKRTVNFIRTITKGEPGYVVELADEFVPASDTYFLDGTTCLMVNSDTFRKLQQKASYLNKELASKVLSQSEVLNQHVNAYPIFVYHAHCMTYPTTNEDLPKDCDPLVFEFLMNKISDFNVYEYYSEFLDYVTSVSSLYIEPIESASVMYVNINYSYDIGVRINRSNFRNFVTACGSGFTAEYHKTSDRFVTVYLPFEIPTHLQASIKRTKKPEKMCHKFIVYKTGSVTQSGPHPELNHQAYILFMTMIKSGTNVFEKKLIS